MGSGFSVQGSVIFAQDVVCQHLTFLNTAMPEAGLPLAENLDVSPRWGQRPLTGNTEHYFGKMYFAEV